MEGIVTKGQRISIAAVRITAGAMFLTAGLEKDLVEDMKPLLAADPDGTAAAAVGICALGPMLHALEVGQDIGVGPAAGTLACPAVIVLRVAAQKHHAVHQRGAAQTNTARMVDDAPVEMALGHRRIPAHVGPARLEILTEAAGYAYSPAGVGRTLLEKQHSAGGVFRQSSRR